MLTLFRRFWIVTDKDQRGERAAAYWLSLTGGCGQRALPPGGAKDITDAWKAGEDLRAWAVAVRGGPGCKN